jgi:hypothetical protein
MASSYQGYSGYGSPERAKVDRARQMAELLQQGATDTSPKSFWEGAAQLGKAFIARGAMDKADQAETSYSKNQARLLNHFLDPNTTADGFLMQPTINVGADPEPEAAAPAPASPASPMPDRDKMRALANVLGGVYEGNGATSDIGAKQVSLPPMQPPMQPGAPAAAPTAPQTQSGVSPQVQTIAAALAPQLQAGAPTMTPTAPTMAAPMAPAPSFIPPQPAAPDRRAALQSAMRLTGGNLEQAMWLVEAKYGPAPAGPEYQFLQGSNGALFRGEKTSGQFETLQPGAADPVRYLTEQVGDRMIAYNPANPKETIDMGPAPPKSGGGSDGEPTAYQLWQMRRAEEADAGKAETQAGVDRVAVMGLRDGQERVKKLIGHPGFKGIYGPFGAMGINMGAKPTNLMNQDELNAMALLDQIGGEAFLTGIQKMRGTGPVSENEGKRVAAAVTSLLNRMQSPAAAEAAATEFMASMAALEQAYMKESGGAAMPTGMSMPDDVESSGIFNDVMEGAANMFGGVANMFTGGGRMKPGTVDVDEDTGERYRFKGGDPRDQKNWEPVR